jgi:steroid 5-alpha reductase family enzyme
MLNTNLLLSALVDTAIAVWAHMTLFFIIAWNLKRNDVADIAWGLGFIVVAVVNVVNNLYLRSGVILVLAIFWGLRLATYIYLRNRGKKEDYRYKQMKKDWQGSQLVNTYFKVFMFQGLMMILVSAPLLLVSVLPQAQTGIWLYLGIIIWLVGFFFETVGDWQLYKFKQDPANKGKIMTKGLWQYTRHPNYFGEVTMWWGIFIIMLGLPYGWLALISPITITLLILGISGVPMLEKRYDDNQVYQEYKKKTSAFFPWLPKQ